MVKRRKFQLLPAVLFVAGAALIVVNNMYGADLTNNLRSSIVFIGGIMVVAGMIMAPAPDVRFGRSAFPPGGALFPALRGALFRPRHPQRRDAGRLGRRCGGVCSHETCAGSGC